MAQLRELAYVHTALAHNQNSLSLFDLDLEALRIGLVPTDLTKQSFPQKFDPPSSCHHLTTICIFRT